MLRAWNKSGPAPWRRFFALTSGIFALKENRSVVSTLSGDLSLTLEMQTLARELRVVDRLRGWSNAMRSVLEQRPRDALGDYCYSTWMQA